jgi:asparagine synthase (glutamine-hydrolysing)
MSRELVRRGPDSGGLLHTPVAVLGHRRLAIFDLSSAGNQPMATPDGRVAVVFNGAVYNFQPARLEADGVRFLSQTDTEVLLTVTVPGASTAPSGARGMFAFALWDADRRRCTVRDRLGVKPLVYANAAERSPLRPLAGPAGLRFRSEIDPQASWSSSSTATCRIPPRSM